MKERTMYVLIAVKPPKFQHGGYVATCETICSSSDANAKEVDAVALQLSRVARGELCSLPQGSGQDRNAALADAIEILKDHLGFAVPSDLPKDRPGMVLMMAHPACEDVPATLKRSSYACFSRMDEAVNAARDDQYIVFAESVATGTEVYFVIDHLEQMGNRKVVIVQSPIGVQ